jgi:hypothetical protein
MNSQVFKSLIVNSLRRLGVTDGVGEVRRRPPRRNLGYDSRAVESLETRTVLSGSGAGSLLGILSDVGVVTSPIIAPAQPATLPNQNPNVTQLDTDVHALLTEFQGLATRSAVSIADLESLTADSQTIAQSHFHFDSSTLNPVISELATAVAGGTSTAQAQTDFSALFSGSSVSSTVINSTFGDVVKAIGDSGITTTDLVTVAADEAAIKTDLSNLPWRFQPLGDGLLSLEAGPSLSLSLSSSAISLPTITIAASTIPVSLGLGSSLEGGLTDAGVVTSPVFATQVPSSAGTQVSAYAALKADLQKLQTELQTLASRSGLTVADLESLSVDSQSVAQTGFYLNPQTLNPVISELATAVAGAVDVPPAAQAFTNLFSGSNVSAAVINTTFNDLVKAIDDSRVAPADLSAVAADQAAVQTDLQNLQKKTTGPGRRGFPVHHHVVHPFKHPRFKVSRPHARR